MQIEEVSLSSLSCGVADELFAREFEKVLENIADPNTSPSETRTITLVVKVKPNDGRENGSVSVQAFSKLSRVVEHKDPIYFSRQAGKFRAFQSQRVVEHTLFDNVAELTPQSQAK